MSLDSTALLSPHDAALLHRHAADADATGWLHPAQQALIHDRDWLRLLAPRAVGGAERPLPQVVRLEEALAHADGSCGWVVTLCAGAGWFAGFLPPAVAHGLLATPNVCFAGSGAATGTATRDGDGWRLAGRWGHATGEPMATHFTLNAQLHEADGRPMLDAAGAPRVRAFVVHRTAVRTEATWHAIGLRATASNSYVLADERVPDGQGFDIDAAAATAPGPLYRFPFLPLAYVTLGANLAGMARRFVELAQPVIEQRRQLRGEGRLGEQPAVQARLAQARDHLAAARSRCLALLDRVWAQVEAGAADPGDTAALQDASLAWVQAARDAVDGLYPYAGLQAADPRGELNRVWRDFHTATQHGLMLP